MEQIITDFGVKPILLAAQILNFLVLFLILKKFLYPPILRVLEQRRQIVTDSLNNAEKIEQRLQRLEDESSQRLAEVSKEAQKILDKASNTADDIIAKAHQQAQTDIERMLEKGQHNLLLEREKMQREMRDELMQLVVLGIEKTSGKILEQADHKRILEQQIADLKNQ